MTFRMILLTSLIAVLIGILFYLAFTFAYGQTVGIASALVGFLLVYGVGASAIYQGYAAHRQVRLAERAEARAAAQEERDAREREVAEEARRAKDAELRRWPNLIVL